MVNRITDALVYYTDDANVARWAFACRIPRSRPRQWLYDTRYPSSEILRSAIYTTDKELHRGIAVHRFDETGTHTDATTLLPSRILRLRFSSAPGFCLSLFLDMSLELSSFYSFVYLLFHTLFRI